MGGQSPNHRDRAAGEIADEQHGVAEHGQLLAAGLTHRMIERSLAAGRLRPLFARTYAVGHRAVSNEGWMQAALLTCGGDSTLGGETACLLWRLRFPEEVLPITVFVGGDRGRKQRGINARRVSLQQEDWLKLDGLRVTTPARTIVDMAGELSGRPMRRLVERAQDLDRFDATLIEQALERNPRRPGCRDLLTLTALLQPDSDNARSYLERLFLQLIKRRRLPLPEVNAEIEGRKRDFVWRDQRLVVEVDGYASHSSKWAIARDKRRDRRLIAALWRPVRFTYEEVAFEPEATMTELAGLLAPLR